MEWCYKKWYTVAIYQYLNRRTNSSYNKAVNVLLNYAKHKAYAHDIPIPKPVNSTNPEYVHIS